MSSLISIILPVYNGERYLKESIESCLKQTYQNFELLIVNDASTDNSLSLGKSYAKIDPRIKIYSNKENVALPRSLNIGHHKAEGSFVTWTSDDNILKPDFLKTLYSEIVNQNCDIVYSNYDIIWANGEFKREHITGPITSLIFGDCIGASFLYKKEVFELLGGYNTDLVLVEDFHFFLKSALKFKFYHLEKNLYQYRIHEKSLTGKIHRNINYRIQHEKSLEIMYNDIGKDINLREITIELILNLYFRKPISLKQYFKNSKVIMEDINRYESSLKSKEKISSLFFLDKNIRSSIFLHKREQTFMNLIRIIIRQKSVLFRKNFNKNATLKLFYLCVKGG